VLCHLSRAGEEVELGGRIAYVAETDEELAGIGQIAERAAPAPVVPSEVRATKKAVALAERHGVDLALLEKDGFITGEDVEAFVAGAGDGRAPAAADRLLAGVSTGGVSLPAHFGLDEGTGRLEPDFLASLRADPDAIRTLPSEERCEAYRRAGAVIGEAVVLGERTLIVAPQIVLDDRVNIGDDSLVECAEVFAVGALTHFGAGLRVRCRRAFVGANGHIGRKVEIGGGGSLDPWATFAAGDLVYIGEEAFINPCRPVLLGREVFLTMRSVLVTHNVGHSLLEGFENRFAPIVLEDRSQVGIGTVVYAGCRIGSEAIVASNSYVVSDIPAGKLAIGVPARVAGSATHPLSRDRQAKALRTMIDDLQELLEARGVDVSSADDDAVRGFRVSHDGRTSLVVAVEKLGPDHGPSAADDETVILTLELAADPPAGAAVLDLLARRVHGDGGVVLDSVREFCRKRGIRMEPGPWRYSGGLI
jgi:acetyltransferase-like isoleucine patch superfamily enzyme